MEDLLPLDRYLSSILGQGGGAWRRMSWIVSGFYGLVITLSVLWSMWPSGGWQAIAIAAGVGIVCSGVGGFLFSCSIRWWLTRTAKAIYRGAGSWAVSPPTGRDLLYRLPCTWKKSATMGVGGVLFLASDALIFVPHSRNLPRDRGYFEIPMGSASAIEIAKQVVRPWQRVLFSEVPPILRVTDSQGAWDFLVPSPEEVAARLRSIFGN